MLFYYSRIWILLLIYLIGIQVAFCKTIGPDDTKAATILLNQQRASISEIRNVEEKIQKMLDLGLWSEANTLLLSSRASTNNRLLKAEFLYLNNSFFTSEKIVDSILLGNKSNAKALLLKAELEVESWKMSTAEDILKELLQKNNKNSKSAFILANAYLLEGKTKEARLLSTQLKVEYPLEGLGDLIEGRILLLENNPRKADSAIRIGIEKDPLNADLRFYYGYLKWRIGDGDFLNLMENEWVLCLQINPLHFLAHWHLGNGHTNKTFEDSYPNQDSSIKKALANFDPLISQKKFADALILAQGVQVQNPKSIIPLLYKASAYYMFLNIDFRERIKNLDSAQTLYFKVLALNEGNGSAHNGIAAVIKAKRVPFLYFYDSLKAKINSQTLQNTVAFHAVVPETTYFPEFVEKMAMSEFHTSEAYLPLLSRGGYKYHIMALHHNLAETLSDPYFNQASTFDHRKWMDIRGVGSGAVGLEYVAKGAFYERNVLLHEFIHLIHSTLTTDRDRRKIRSLYFSAKKSGKILDYYASANEDEYFAQIYPAYYSKMAVHPQDFKSYNTAGKLKRIDPNAYSFIDSLVKIENQFLAGNQTVFKDQWCELYIHLALKSPLDRPVGKAKALSYLDSASNWDKDYLPLLIAKSEIGLKTGDLDLAELSLKKAEAINSNYSPIFIKNYELNKAVLDQGLLDYSSSFELQKSYLLKAISIEKDPVVLSIWKTKLIDFYTQNSLIADAFQSYNDFLSATPISSYQKEERNSVFADFVLRRAELGYNERIEELKAIYLSDPADYGIELKYARALNEIGQINSAISLLEKSMKIKEDSGIKDPESVLYLAYLQAKTGNKGRANQLIQYSYLGSEDSTLLKIRVWQALGQEKKAEKLLNAIVVPHELFYKSLFEELKGDLALQKNFPEEVLVHYQQAVFDNPYNFKATQKLLAKLKIMKRETTYNLVLARMNSLPVKPGIHLQMEN